jgi:capsular polysaccharide biosynthesis protein
MEFKIFKDFFIKKLTIFLITGIFSGIFGIAIYFYSSETYNTQGTFLVMPDLGFSITSEDYRSQDELSKSYTGTIVGILNAPEIRNNVQKAISREGKSSNTLILSIKTSVKEIAPRLIVLTVSSDTFENSEKLFIEYETELLKTISSLKTQELFTVTRISEDLVTTKVEKNIIVYFFIGYIVGFFSSLIYYFLKDFSYEK